MSETASPEHMSWLENLLGSGGSDQQAAPQDAQPSPAPAADPQPAANPQSSWTGEIFGTDSTNYEAPSPAPADAPQTDGDAQSSWAAKAFGIDSAQTNTLDLNAPDEAPDPAASAESAGASAAEGSQDDPSETAPTAPAADEQEAGPATTSAASGASAGEEAESAPGFLDKVIAASIVDPVWGVPKVLGGEINDWMAERDRQAAADEHEKEVDRQLAEQHQQAVEHEKRMEEARDEDARVEKARDEEAKKRWEKIMQDAREKQEQEKAYAQLQKDEAEKARRAQEEEYKEIRKSMRPIT